MVSEGHYGIPVVTHCCLEPHGQVIQWQGDTASDVCWPSTQNVTGYAGSLAPNLKVPDRQHQGEDGLHRRRLRQQVRARCLGRGGRPPFAEGRRPSGEAVPRPRHRADDRRQPSFGLRQNQDRRQQGRHHHAPGSPNPGPPAASTGGGSPPLPYVIRQHSQQAAEPHVRFRQCRPAPRLARSQQPAGLVSDLQRDGGFRGQGRAGSAGSFQEERSVRSRGARGDLPLPVATRPPRWRNGRSSGSRAARAAAAR